MTATVYRHSSQTGRPCTRAGSIYDRDTGTIIDNRYIIANLIACDRDTPRVIDGDLFSTVFDLQEKVIENILSSFEEQKAREAAPRSLDPIQQAVATAIQGYLSHPQVDRAAAVDAIKFVSQPMRRIQVTRLRQAFREFQRAGTVRGLLETIAEIRAHFREPPVVTRSPNQMPSPLLTRDDLRLICFDLISS
jgi:hypothetical protein